MIQSIQHADKLTRHLANMIGIHRQPPAWAWREVHEDTAETRADILARIDYLLSIDHSYFHVRSDDVCMLAAFANTLRVNGAA